VEEIKNINHVNREIESRDKKRKKNIKEEQERKPKPERNTEHKAKA